MRREKALYEAAGLQIVLIGLGVPEKAREFRDALALPFRVLCDPEKASYQAFGLLRRLNLLREVNPLSAWHFVANATRYGVAGTKQDMLQLGGVFIVDSSSTVRYVFESVRASEQPNTADVLRSMTRGG